MQSEAGTFLFAGFMGGWTCGKHAAIVRPMLRRGPPLLARSLMSSGGVQEQGEDEGKKRWEQGDPLAFRVDGTSEKPDGYGRLALYLHNRCPWLFPTASSARGAVRRQEVGVSGVMGNTITELAGGEEIVIYPRGKSPFRQKPEATTTLTGSFKLPKVLFEDDHMAAVVKPVGMTMYYDSTREGRKQRASGPPDLLSTLSTILQPSVLDTALPGGAAAVHRLDKGTGGIVLCCKTVEAARSLSQQFLERSIQKRYRAVVIGLVSEPGEMQGDVDGKDAFSVYSPVRSSRSLKFGWLTLLDLWPRTGRRHQLRIHLASRGTPIAGDQTYGMWMKRLKGGHGSWAPMQMGEGEPGMKVDGHELPFNRRPDVGPPDAGEGWDVAHTAVLQRKGMLLWASEVVLQHPLDGREMRISAPESKKFGEVMSKEQSRWDRLGEQA